MAFNPNYLKLWSVNNVPAVFNANIASNANPIPNLWGYKTSTDTIATVSTAGYFKSFGNPKFNDIRDVVLKVGDQIWCNCSNGGVNLYISALNPTTTTISNNPVGANTITTAMIQNLAVTTALINTAAVTSAKLAASTIQYLPVTILASEWLGMYVTPKLLVPAGGANTIISVQDINYEVNYGGAAFAAGGVFNAEYDAVANGAGTAATTTSTAATAFWAADSLLKQTGVMASAAATLLVNKGIYLSNLTGAFTTGTSVVTAHVRYAVLTLTL